MSAGATPEPPEPEKPAGGTDPLSGLVDRLSSFDPADFEKKLGELADALKLPDLSGLLAPLGEQLDALEGRIDALVKEVRRLVKAGAPAGAGPQSGDGPTPTSGNGEGAGAPAPPPPVSVPSPPRGNFGSIFSDVPHIGD